MVFYIIYRSGRKLPRAGDIIYRKVKGLYMGFELGKNEKVVWKCETDGET